MATGNAKDLEKAQGEFKIPGINYSITNRPEDYNALLSWIDEAVPFYGLGMGRNDHMVMVIERVEFLHNNKFPVIASRAYEKKIKSSRTSLRGRMTMLTEQIMEAVKVAPELATVDQAADLNSMTIELQRMMVDEAAMSLMMRKDYDVTKHSGDVILRRARIKLCNDAILAAEDWMNSMSPLDDQNYSLTHLIEKREPSEKHDQMITSLREEEEEDPAQKLLGQEETRKKVVETVKDPGEEVTEQPTVIPAGGRVSPEPEKSKGQPEQKTSTPVRKKVSVFLDREESFPKGIDTDQPKKNIKEEDIWFFDNTLGVQYDGKRATKSRGATGDRSSMFETALSHEPGPEPKEDRLTRRFEYVLNKTTEALEATTRGGLNEKLPKYHGNIAAWNAFWQQFVALVDTNPRIGTAIKLARLVNALEGEAYNAIKHLEFEEGNYEQIKLVLERRFGDPDLVLQSLTRKLMQQEQVGPNDYIAFRRFVDVYTQTVRAHVRQHPEVIHAPNTLLNMGFAKLPQEVLIKWEEKRINEVTDGHILPVERTLSSFIQWLNQMAEAKKKAMYRNPESKDGKKISSKSTDQSKQKSSTPTLNNFLTVEEQQKTQPRENRKCIFCNSKNHWTSKCTADWVKQNPMRAMNMAFRARICVRCLRSGHRANDCKRKMCPVENCGRNHHEILHMTVKDQNQKNSK